MKVIDTTTRLSKLRLALKIYAEDNRRELRSRIHNGPVVQISHYTIGGLEISISHGKTYGTLTWWVHGYKPELKQVGPVDTSVTAVHDRRSDDAAIIRNLAAKLECIAPGMMDVCAMGKDVCNDEIARLMRSSS